MKKKLIILLSILIFMIFLSPFSRNTQVMAESLRDVFVTNFPEIFKTKEQPRTTVLLGSEAVYIRHEDLMDVPPIPTEKILLGSYTGSGKMTYLVARGSNDASGVEIVIDGRSVAFANGYNLDILGSGASTGWKLLRPTTKDVFEVNTTYAFKEKIEIYLWNHSFETIKAGAHVELEVD
ncbi:MAG: hypothetical protein Q7S03_01090 [bacterium]|nr:hypothetical protein [bacterium]